MRFSHSKLLELSQRIPEIQEAWDGIWGRRYNNLLRAKEQAAAMRGGSGSGTGAIGGAVAQKNPR